MRTGPRRLVPRSARSPRTPQRSAALGRGGSGRSPARGPAARALVGLLVALALAAGCGRIGYEPPRAIGVASGDASEGDPRDAPDAPRVEAGASDAPGPPPLDAEIRSDGPPSGLDLRAPGPDAPVGSSADASVDASRPPVDTGAPPVDTAARPPIDTAAPPVDAPARPPVDASAPPDAAVGVLGCPPMTSCAWTCPTGTSCAYQCPAGATCRASCSGPQTCQMACERGAYCYLGCASVTCQWAPAPSTITIDCRAGNCSLQ